MENWDTGKKSGLIATNVDEQLWTHEGITFVATSGNNTLRFELISLQNANVWQTLCSHLTSSLGRWQKDFNLRIHNIFQCGEEFVMSVPFFQLKKKLVCTTPLFSHTRSAWNSTQDKENSFISFKWMWNEMQSISQTFTPPTLWLWHRWNKKWRTSYHSLKKSGLFEKLHQNGFTEAKNFPFTFRSRSKV